MPGAFPSRGHLPHACGVYIMRDAAMTVLYVGKAKDLAKRVAQYFNPNKPDLKNQSLAPLVRKIDYIHCASEREALIWERRLIRRHQPFFNAMWKDDKSYPMIRLSMGEDFPRIRLTRKRVRGGDLLFGPYPKASHVKQLLRHLWKRRLFPLRPCDWEFSRKKPLDPRRIKACLYYHTGECTAPCAGRIARRAYRRIAEDAALFLQGRYTGLRRRFETEMRRASRRMDYEAAARLRDNLLAIEHMGERVRYREVRPGRVAERLDASRAVTELQKALRLPRPPHAVECFDISHLFGRETVGSMVRFTGGQADRTQYRRFRVRSVSGIDDFASVREVVFRRYGRLSREGRTLPDLALIDGGKGQLAAAYAALRELKLKLPLAALAKREEEVFLPGRSAPVRLAQDSPALRLLMRVRDEAHRFAVAYHRLLRKKAIINLP